MLGKHQHIEKKTIEGALVCLKKEIRRTYVKLRTRQKTTCNAFVHTRLCLT